VGDKAPSYKGFRFPVEIIAHGVWLYHRFPLSFREVQEMMRERGVVVSHETVRQWCAKVRADLRQRTAPATPRGSVAP
jgi:putative transposase